MLDPTLNNFKRTRADIARENGAKSHGPVTAVGKARASENAVVHSLTATKFVCLSNEDDIAYKALSNSYVDLWKPENIMETHLVDQMVVAQWQQERCLTIETALFNLQIQNIGQDEKVKQIDGMDAAAIQALAFMNLADATKALPLLIRYRSMHLRNYDRAMKQLIALRTKPAYRKAVLPNEPRTAANINITKAQASGVGGPIPFPESTFDDPAAASTRKVRVVTPEELHRDPNFLKAQAAKSL